MRNWSFFLTVDQVRARTKTVTRREVRPSLPQVGELRQPVVKTQGLKSGQHVEKIGGPVRVLSVRFESLDAITADDCVKEGFPGMRPIDFVKFYRQHNGGSADQTVARIEFEYVDAE